MKLIIAGSRSLKVSNEEIRELLVHFDLVPTCIVSGTANGIDICGEQYAYKYKIDIERFPANWDLYGKSSGMMRNRQMAQYADALLLIWDGVSKGSAGMKAIMQACNKPIYEVVDTAKIYYK